MKTQLKFLFLFSFVLSACGINSTINTDAAKVEDAVSEIVNLELPQGYTAEFFAEINGYSLVSYNRGTGSSHLYLIQSENEADAEKLADMVNVMAPGAYDPKTRMEIIKTQNLTVRDKEATLIISEGINGEKLPYRQMMLVFEGKGGPALLLLSEASADWNEETVEALVKSVQ